jgi:hypothetical protein
MEAQLFPVRRFRYYHGAATPLSGERGSCPGKETSAKQHQHFSECLIESAEEGGSERLRAEIDDLQAASVSLAGCPDIQQGFKSGIVNMGYVR